MRNYISVKQTVVTRWYLNPVTTVCYLFLILLSLTLQAFRIQQEIINIDCQNTIFIIIWLHNIFCNDNFLKRVINLPERSDFLRPLCFIRKRICRLNVISGRTKIADKIHFQLPAVYLSFQIFFEVFSNFFSRASFKGLPVVKDRHQHHQNAAST